MTNHNFQVGDTVIFVNDGRAHPLNEERCRPYFGSIFKITSIGKHPVRGDPECIYTIDLPFRMYLPATCLRYVPPPSYDRIDREQLFRDSLIRAPITFDQILDGIKTQEPLTEERVRGLFPPVNRRIKWHVNDPDLLKGLGW